MTRFLLRAVSLCASLVGPLFPSVVHAQVPIPGEFALTPRIGASIGITGAPALIDVGVDLESSITGPLHMSFGADAAFATGSLRILAAGGVKRKFPIERKAFVPYVRGLMTLGFTAGEKSRGTFVFAPKGGGGFRLHAYEGLSFGIELLVGVGGRVGEKNEFVALFDAVACVEIIL